MQEIKGVSVAEAKSRLGSIQVLLTAKAQAQQQVTGRKDVVPLHQEIHVAHLAEGQVAIGGEGQEGTFVRDDRDAGGGELVVKPEQFAGEKEARLGIGVAGLGQFGEYGFRDVACAQEVEVMMQERHEAMSASLDVPATQ